MEVNCLSFHSEYTMGRGCLLYKPTHLALAAFKFFLGELKCDDPACASV
jgi:hypothetical protein